MNKKNLNDLFKAAKKVRLRAHAPYSNFKVGAALLDEKGNIHVGCNVENSSYGGTICAERSAITAMVAAGAKKIVAIAVVTDTPQGCPPCGFCRQVILEFSDKRQATDVVIATTKAIKACLSMDELLPYAFDAGYLRK